MGGAGDGDVEITRRLSDTAIEAAARLLVEQGVNALQPGSMTIMEAGRRSGLAAADAAHLGACVTDLTPYAPGGDLGSQRQEGQTRRAKRDTLVRCFSS